MTKRDTTALQAHLRLTADLLGLRDWSLELEGETGDSANLGECEPVYGQKYAKIAFCKDFRELPADKQRYVVVHELLHCHLAHIQECYEAKALHEQLGVPLAKVFESQCQLALEYAVDAIAREWALSLPRIGWPD